MTPAIRYAIASQALLIQEKHLYGGISALANKYKVCRQFVYTLLSTLQIIIPHIFFPTKQAIRNTKKEMIAAILSYRLEGGSSIEAISTLMNRFEVGYSSVGYISQSLSSIGKLLASSVKAKGDKKHFIVYASDEIFSKRKAILITVDPISTAILNIVLGDDRSAKTWSRHFETIESNGFKASGIVSDGGVGLQFGRRETLKDAIFQPDTYHAIAHRLGIWVSQFEKSAYRAIKYEYSRKAVIDTAKSQRVILKRTEAYRDALFHTSKAIDLYEDFRFLYRCIINSLKPFHNDGRVRDCTGAKEEIETALLLMETLNHKQITQKIKTIRGTLSDLLNYFAQTKRALQKCERIDIQAEALQLLCAVWQWDKALIKAKVTHRREYARTQKALFIKKAKFLLQNDYERLKVKVFNELDTIIQASSIVEGINSILRPYLDRSKNQVTQNFLNLFMFYHNHRRYRAGKRKGKTPLEILTREKQDKDWIELLTDFIEKVEPTFFL